MIEKNQRWAYHDDSLPQDGGAGVTRRILAYTDTLMCCFVHALHAPCIIPCATGQNHKIGRAHV